MQIQKKRKRRSRPDTDQLERCRSDRAGSADRSTFVIPDTEEKEKRRKTAQRDSEKESVRETFHPVFTVQVSSPETATRIEGYWVSFATHTAPLRNPHPAGERDSL